MRAIIILGLFILSIVNSAKLRIMTHPSSSIHTTLTNSANLNANLNINPYIANSAATTNSGISASTNNHSTMKHNTLAVSTGVSNVSPVGIFVAP